MEIQLNEEWRITSDSRQWIVERGKVAGEGSKNAGARVWKQISFHADAEQAVSSAYERRVREISGSAAPDILREIQRLRDECARLRFAWTV